VLLVVGVAIAVLCAFTAGAAALALARSDGEAPAAADAALGGPASKTALMGYMLSALRARYHRLLGAHLGAAWRGARELARDNPLSRLVSRGALVVAVRQPQRVLAVGLALAALGWGLDTQTRVETDITKLVPQSLASLQNLTTLERATGVGGGIDLMLSGRDVARPSTIAWMSSYESAMLKRFGYSSSRGCGKARLCPAFSLPDLFQGQALSGAGASKLSQAEVNGLLEAIPPYFSQDVITADRRQATLAFGIRLMGLDQQQQLIEAMRSGLHPPPGVRAQLVGLPVLAAQSGSQVASPWRRLETLLAGLAAVALVLLLAFRGDRRRALAPLAPIVLATGWSALILFAVRVPLNPMSVTLGALVIAISTEFSVLLSERFRQERLAGHETIEALRRSYQRTGAAVAASGVTAIAGFGVLALSDIRMLRDFGIVTLIDLSVSLVGVLVALPAALVIAERDEPAALARGPRRGLASLLGGVRALDIRRPAASATRRAGSGHEPA
jgi:predicted RND superfamily exporter protein